MSVLDSLKRGASAIKNNVKAAKNEVFKKQYCTSVLNDFSFVRKALFHVYKENGDYNGVSDYTLNKHFDYIDSFPVQINPNSIHLTYGSDKKPLPNSPLTAAERASGVPVILPSERYSPGSLQISLEYNIYDEYNARTVGGSIPENSISLHSGNHTSLEQLRNLAGNVTRMYVMFRWGEIHYFGALQSVNITYNVFSPWGEPLAASATIDIAHQPLEFDKSTGEEKDPLDCGQLESIDTGDKLTMKNQDIITRTGLTASTAMR